jgi:hypothetical protein
MKNWIEKLSNQSFQEGLNRLEQLIPQTYNWEEIVRVLIQEGFSRETLKQLYQKYVQIAALSA